MAERSINELFGIDFRADGFISSAKFVVTEQIARKVKQHEVAIKTLSQEISERFPTVTPPSASDLSQIKKKFSLYKTEGQLSHEHFSDKEIRSMCYFANQIAKSTEDYHILIYLIQKRWRQSYLNGLVFCLLYNWTSLEYDIVSSEFRSFIVKQLENYQGQRNHLCKMKQNIQFIKDGGSFALGQFVLSNQDSIIDAPSIIGLKKRDLGYSFFSKVIQYYFRNRTNTVLPELEEALSLHANVSTTKIVLSDKIIKADKLSNDLQATVAIKRIAIKLIGDPFIKSNWNTLEIGQEYKSQINQAHTIMRKWLINSYLNVAFERLINDPARKQFWLKYMDYIDDIKIIGNLQHKNLIGNDPMLKDALMNCFRLQRSYSTSSTCAVAIQIKDHYFFEFSDVGACYVYDNNNKMEMLERGINKISDLKDPNMNNLVTPCYYDYSYYKSGRFIHSGNWQTRFHRWFKVILDIHV